MSQHRSANRAERLLQIMDILKGQTCNARELSQLTGVSQRTIERDLTELQDLSKIQRLPTTNRYRTPPLTGSALNEVEGLSVYIALRMLHHAGNDNTHQRRVLGKLLTLLPTHLQDDAQRIISAAPQQRGDEERTFELVARALQTRQLLTFNYEDAQGNKRHRRLDVHRVEVNPENLALYVVGHDPDRNERRVLKLNRMSNTHLASQQGNPPPPISTEATPWGVSALGGGPTVSVHLRFTPEAKRRLLERPHPALRIAPHAEPDGWWKAEITVSQNNPEEILPMLLSWSNKVIVDGPSTLRSAWLQRIQELAIHARTQVSSP